MQTLHLFRDIAEDAFESRKADLKDDGKAGRWFSPLELHVLPKIGRVPVVEIDQIKIRDALTPIWHNKADTARKALNRIAICIRHASNLGLDVDIQAAEKARGLLGRQRHEVKHVPALPWQEVPAFYASLNNGSTTHLALRFLILTGMRSKAVRFAHIDQIDDNAWTVPAANMKGRKGRVAKFRVPLSPEAQAIIGQASPLSRDGFLFPSVRKGVISDVTMSRLMERRGIEARPHGFRSSLREWLADQQDCSWELAEMCLAHTVRSKVARAYMRSDQLEARRTQMKRWAAFCNGS
jgi:integrase